MKIILRAAIAATVFAGAVGAQTVAPAAMAPGETLTTTTHSTTAPVTPPAMVHKSTTTVTTTPVTPPAVTSTHTKVTNTTTAPDGVMLHNGHWMKGSRHATNHEIAAHKRWMAAHDMSTTK